MKTEKQVRTWIIHNGHSTCPAIVGSQIVYGENVKVIHHDDHLAIVAEKDALIEKLVNEIKEMGCNTLPIELVKRDWMPK